MQADIKQKQQSTDLTQFPESHERCCTVCVDKRTRRGHFTSAGNAAVRSVFGGKDGVEENVTSVNRAVSICEMIKQTRASVTLQ